MSSNGGDAAEIENISVPGPTQRLASAQAPLLAVFHNRWNVFAGSEEHVTWEIFPGRLQNGSIVDGLTVWKSNVDKRFEGVEECYICFYILHGANHSLPKVQSSFTFIIQY